jgi:hypothetical protein
MIPAMSEIPPRTPRTSRPRKSMFRFQNCLMEDHYHITRSKPTFRAQQSSPDTNRLFGHTNC